MKRETELELIDELLNLKAKKSAYLVDNIGKNPVEHYASEARFKAERDKLFYKLPVAIAHKSELAKPGDFLRKDIAGLPILLTHDKAGNINAFLNVCRHRGTRLVDDEAGCKHRFTCPYHAWTYSSTGDLMAAPHFDQGFPEKQKEELGLKRLDCQVRHGFVWVTAQSEGSVDLKAYFGELDDELGALKMDEMVVMGDTRCERASDWKLLLEGGIEAYHFKVAHRKTIGPHFEDNLSSFRTFGPNMRSILPRTSMAKLTPETRESWRLRDHAQILYNLFPSLSLLVQQDHVAVVLGIPTGVGKTDMRIMTIAPSSEAENKEHWKINQKITTDTLDEDFTIGESIQSTLNSGANSEMIFGRFEGALADFNKTVEHYLSDPNADYFQAD